MKRSNCAVVCGSGGDMDYFYQGALKRLLRSRLSMQLLASGPIIAGAALLSSCAGTKVGRISNPAYQVDGRFSDAKAQGIRYYESAPFLLVYSDGKGGLVSKLLFLPDLTQKRTVDPYALLASNNTTLTFTNGVLTQGKTVVDETIVPKAVVGALEKAAGVALKAFNVAGGGASGNLPPPLLFKIILKNGSARLAGGKSVGSDGTPRAIGVTVSAPNKEGGEGENSKAAAESLPAPEEDKR